MTALKTCHTSHVGPSVESDEDARRDGPSRAGAYQWAELMRRTFGFDVLACVRGVAGGSAKGRVDVFNESAQSWDLARNYADGQEHVIRAATRAVAG